jgi:hypothetical protein
MNLSRGNVVEKCQKLALRTEHLVGPTKSYGTKIIAQCRWPAGDSGFSNSNATLCRLIFYAKHLNSRKQEIPDLSLAGREGGQCDKVLVA